MIAIRITGSLLALLIVRSVLSAQPGSPGSIGAAPPDSAGNAGSGCLIITSVPGGAGVIIQGVYAGATPLWVVRRPGDSISILVLKQFFEPWQTAVSLKGGDTVRMTAIPHRLHTRLTVIGSDPEANVYVDGLFAGSGSVINFPVLPGAHELLVRDSLTGRSARRYVTFGEAQAQDYAADLGYRSVWRLAGSMVIPGYAQWADGAYLKGGGLFALSAAAIAFTAGSAGAYSDRLGDYNNAAAGYAAAPTEQDAVIRREIMFQRHDDLNNAYRTRTVAFVALGAVYALNIVDTILNHMLVDDIRFLPGRTDVKFVASAGRSSLMLRTELILR
jgi:hypothetical protein